MLNLYNTLSKKKEEFISLDRGKVKLYTCGPTVYDYAHIGNLKTFIFEDVLRRYLEYSGYEVLHIMNITDVGHLTEDEIGQADTGQDKMLKASLREKKSPEEIAQFYTDRFFEDIKSLNFKKANFYPRPTTHIPHIIKFIKELMKKGFAYEVNGNVFFDVAKFSEYGKLSGNTLDKLKVGARLEEHPDKKKPYDFSLWLKAPAGHIMRWESPWSVGYPGWHIECSVMSIEYLGETLDIHTGGEDHIFPHHENEIAQSEAHSGKKFSNYWMHARFLLVDGQKMSKSKGNFYALKDVIEKGFSPMDFRLFALSGHYRSHVNFTWEVLEQAHKNLQKINDFVLNLEAIAKKEKVGDSFDISSYKEKFEAAMDDDLNTPLALAVLYELITVANKRDNDDDLSSSDAKNILALWKKINSVFGLLLQGQAEISQEIKDLVEKRELARSGKDFKKSDELRAIIEKHGFVVEDSKDGPIIKQDS